MQLQNSSFILPALVRVEQDQLEIQLEPIRANLRIESSYTHSSNRYCTHTDTQTHRHTDTQTHIHPPIPIQTNPIYKKWATYSKYATTNPKS